MMVSGILLLASCLLTHSAWACDYAPGPRHAIAHSVAQVNDPMSHGALGDNLLSLNEAIQLYNRTITVAQLSPAEIMQLGGLGADIAWARIDASFVPGITIETDFDVILDWPHGLLIEGYNGEAVLDFSHSSGSHGFRSMSNFCNWRNLEIVGGTYGIDLQQTNAAFGGTVINNVLFDGQSQYGLRVTGSAANGWGRVLLGECEFRDTPVGIRLDENMAGRTTVLGIFDTTFRGADVAIDCLLGSGGQATYLLEKLIIEGATTGLRIKRAAGADRMMNLEATHLSITANNCIEYEGSSVTDSELKLRMLNLTANAPDGEALHLGPLGSRLRGELSDCEMVGDVTVMIGGSPTNMAIHNARVADGSVVLGANWFWPVQIDQSRFDNCSVTTTGHNPVVFTESCFVGGSVQGTTAAPIEMAACHLGATPGNHVTENGGLLGEQLGSMSVVPVEPVLGGTVTLQPDLPGGLIGFFVLGAPATLVTEPLPGVRAYLDPTQSVVAVAFVQQQHATTLPIPTSLSLLNTNWICQLLVTPTGGTQAPDVQVPPGQWFVLR